MAKINLNVEGAFLGDAPKINLNIEGAFLGDSLEKKNPSQKGMGLSGENRYMATKKDEDGFWGGLSDTFDLGIQRMGASTLAGGATFLTKLVTGVIKGQYAEDDVRGKKEIKPLIDILEAPAEWLSQNAQKYNEKTLPELNKAAEAMGLKQENMNMPVNQLLRKDVGQGFLKLGIESVKQLPQIIATVAAGESKSAQFATSASLATSQAIQEEYEKDKDVSGIDMLQSSVKGVIEGLTEMIFDTDLKTLRSTGAAIVDVTYEGATSALKNLIKAQGKKQAKEEIVRTWGGVVKQGLKGVGEESLEEGISSAAGFLIDTIDSGKLNAKDYEQAKNDFFDSILIGGFMGGGISSIGASVSKQKLTPEQERQVSRLQEVANDESLSTESREVAASKIEDIKKYNFGKGNEDYKLVANLPVEQRVDALKLTNRIEAFETAKSRAKTEDLIADFDLRIEDLENKRQAIFDEYDASGAKAAAEAKKTQTEKDQESAIQFIDANNIYGSIDTSLAPIQERLNNNEQIDENELDKSADELYAIADKVEKDENLTPEQKNIITAPIFEQIQKLDTYELATKDDYREIIQRQTTKGTREIGRVERQGGAKDVSNNRWAGIPVSVTSEDGTVTNTIAEVTPAGKVILKPKVAFNKKAKIRDAQAEIAKKPLVIDTNFTEYVESKFDEDGNVSGVVLKDNRNNTTFEINDPVLALDIAIKEKQDKLGAVTDAIFEQVLNDEIIGMDVEGRRILAGRKAIPPIAVTEQVKPTPTIVGKLTPRQAVEVDNNLEKRTDNPILNTLGAQVKNVVSNAYKALKSISLDSKMVIYDNEDSMIEGLVNDGVSREDAINSALGAGGLYNPSTGNIHINKGAKDASGNIINTLTGTTIPHEITHAVLAKLAKENPAEFTEMINRILPFIPEPQRSRLQEFAGRYEEDGGDIQAEEFLAELSAMITRGTVKFKTGHIHRIKLAIKDFIKKIADKYKSKSLANFADNLFKNETSAQSDMKFFEDLARSIQSGQKINTNRIDALLKDNKSLRTKAQVTPSVVLRAQKSDVTKTPVAGNRLFNEPLADAKRIASEYMAKKGLKYEEGRNIYSVDKERAKKISDAYMAMPDNYSIPEVKASYDAMIAETIDQYKEIVSNGYKVEINDTEPYKNAQEFIDDLRDNKNFKLLSTLSEFGDTPVTEEMANNDPRLKSTEFKDVNGQTLLANDLFRFVHDFFGHTVRGNSLGVIGEENAWDEHSRMYTPLARKAMTSETRGQNSYVNFSGVNDKAFKLRDIARKLRAEGNTKDADRLVNKVYEMMQFAPQKLGLMPDEFALRDDELKPSLRQQKVSDIPMSANNVLYSDSNILPKPEKKTRNANVAISLQNTAIDYWGDVITSSNITSEQEDSITQNGIEEAKAAYDVSGKSAANWYSTAIETAIAVAGVIHPELNSNEQASNINAFSKEKEPAKAAQLVLRMALAITSQNLNVDANTIYAEEQYNYFKENGKFDPSKEYGAKAPAISSNLKLANLLIDTYGINAAEDFISQEFTVRELEEAFEAATGKKMNILGLRNDIVNGAAIFGPKIGQGFLQNLMGKFDPVTIDLWMRRTWGRWTGDVVGTGITEDRMARLYMTVKDAIKNKELKIDLPKEFSKYKPIEKKDKKGKSSWTMGEDFSNRLDNDLDFTNVLNDVAKEISLKANTLYKAIHDIPMSKNLYDKFISGEMSYVEVANKSMALDSKLKDNYSKYTATQKSKGLKSLSLNDKKVNGEIVKGWKSLEYEKIGNTYSPSNEDISKRKPQWGNAAKNIISDLNPIDIPSNMDRRVITRVVNNIKNGLNKDGYNVTNADVQALLWYPEKDIWAKLRGEEESNLKLSYDDQFIKLANERGLGEQAEKVANKIRNRGAESNISASERRTDESIPAKTNEPQKEGLRQQKTEDIAVNEAIAKESSKLKAQIVWQGSPYSFNKFNTDKIGTGNKSAFGGWGLYFTIKKARAAEYANQLKNEDIEIADIKISKGDYRYKELKEIFEKTNSIIGITKELLNISKENRERSIKFVNEAFNNKFKQEQDKYIEASINLSNKENVDESRKIIKEFEDKMERVESDGFYNMYNDNYYAYRRLAKSVLSGGAKLNNNPSYLYEVSIADDLNLLDFDKRISDENYDKILSQAIKDKSKFLPEIIKNKGKAGRDFYFNVSQETDIYSNDKELSLLMLNAGIDGNTMGSSGTQDIILFDSEAAKIVNQLRQQKTEQKVPNATAASKKAFEQKRKFDISKFPRDLQKWLLDRQVNIRKALKDAEMEFTMYALVNKAGATPLANYKFQGIYKAIYDKMTKEEIDRLDDFIFLRRIIAIDSNFDNQRDQLNKKIRDLVGLKKIAETKEELDSLDKEIKDLHEKVKEKERPEHPAITAPDGTEIVANKESAEKTLEGYKQSLGEDTYNKMYDKSNQYFNAFSDLLKYKFDNGLITREEYNMYKDYNYAPRQFFEHVFGNTDASIYTTRGVSLNQDEIKGIQKGSLDYMETNSMKLLHSAMVATENKVMTNKALQTFFQEAAGKNLPFFKELNYERRKDGTIVTNKDGSLEYKGASNGFTNMIFKVDGINQGFQLDTELAKEFLDVEKWNSNHKAYKLLSNISGAQVLRQMATGLNVGFFISNIPIDLLSQVHFNDIYNGGGIGVAGQYQKAISGTLSTFKSLIGNDAEIQKLVLEYAQAGGLMMTQSQEGTSQAAVLGKIENALSYLGNMSEMASKLNAYKAVKEREMAKYAKENNGATPDAIEQEKINARAAFEARGAMDFHRGGLFTKYVDGFIPYLNVAFQGARITADYIAKNPVKFTNKIIQSGLGVMAITLYNMMVAGDEWDNDDLQQAKAGKLLIFSPLKKADGTHSYIEIPVPTGVKMFWNLFQNMGEGIYYKHIVNKPEKMSGALAKTLADDLAMMMPKTTTMMPPTFKAIYEYSNNKNLWTNRNITYEVVKTKDEGRFDEKVLGIYKIMGKVMDAMGKDLSPIRTQKAVEDVITNPHTDIAIGIAYSMLDKFVNLIPEKFGGLSEKEKSKYSKQTIGDFAVQPIADLLSRATGTTDKKNNGKYLNIQDIIDEENKAVGSYRQEIKFDIQNMAEEKVPMKDALNYITSIGSVGDKKFAANYYKALTEQSYLTIPSNKFRYGAIAFGATTDEARAKVLYASFPNFNVIENDEVMKDLKLMGIATPMTMMYYKQIYANKGVLKDRL